MVIEQNRFYKLQELAGAENTGLSLECLRKMCVSGRLKHIKSGTKYLVSGRVILQLLGGEANATEI